MAVISNPPSTYHPSPSTRQTALITGAARRVGREIAVHLAEQGYDIALHYHTSEPDAYEVKALAEKHNVSCELFRQDLAQIEALPQLIKSVHARFPNLSVLINNASTFERNPFMETDYAFFRKQHIINYESPVMLTQAFAKHVGKGCVINILDSDIATNRGSHFAYLLAKKALAEFTRMSALELGPIRVNAIAPCGMIPADENDVDYLARLQNRLPARRLPTPHDLARMAQMIIEQPALTGAILYLDGGSSLL